MFFRCEAIVSLFQLMELATIQSTTDLKASLHSKDERPQKKGVCDEALISRDFKLFLEVDLLRVLSLFQTHPQSTLKPQPSRSVLSWKIGRRQGFLQMMSHDTTSTGKEGKGVKGGVTRQG